MMNYVVILPRLLKHLFLEKKFNYIMKVFLTLKFSFKIPKL